MLIVIRALKRWLTLETGKVGDDNEPEVEKEDSDSPKSAQRLGFSTEAIDG